MTKEEIIERLKRIANHSVHEVGRLPYILSLDDGVAVYEAIGLLEQPVLHGHWIQKEYFNDAFEGGRGNEWHLYECDQCHLQTKRTSEYCPQCGALMDEKE